MIKIDKEGLKISGTGSEILNELANILNAFMMKGIVSKADLHNIIEFISNESHKDDDNQELACDLLTEAVNLFGEEKASEMLTKLFKKFEK